MRGKDSACVIPRGILKSYIMLVLKDGPLHGYAIIQEIKSKTKFWKPSPGAIYPLLFSMEKEGTVNKRTSGSRIVYSLTDVGKRRAKYVSSVESELKKSILATSSSVMTRGDFARINERFIESEYSDKKALGAVKSANSIWISTIKYFYHGHDERAEEVESLLRETERKMKKILGRR